MRSEVLLPGLEFVVHKWNAGESSFVNKGDVIALVRNGNIDPDAVVVKAHCRPKIRGRNSSSEAKISHKQTALDQTETTSVTPLLATATGLLKRSISGGRDSNPSSLVIGYIVSCTHPAVIDSLCAVCGQSILPKEDSIPSVYVPTEEEKPAMSQVTVSGGITMKISESEAMSLAQSQTERLLELRRLSLVLDLDHTLVHATADPRASQYADREDMRTLLLPTENGMVMHHHVKLRPHLKAFLEQPDYEITVYTAGTRLYAEQITMVLSRYMVDAPLDHADILQLQSRMNHAESKFQHLLAKREKAEDDAKGLAHEGIVDWSRSSQGESSPPRKKVRFGEPAANLKSDEIDILQEDIDELRAELNAAEQKEKEALELRQRIFGSRIFSRTDVGDLGRDVKSLKRIFPCGGTMSVIVDDREDVWANAEENSKEPPHNLLVVRPYHWKPFIGFADVNNAPGTDLSKSCRKEDETSAELLVETDMQLLWTKDILRRVHQRYYSSDQKRTVPEILKEMRSETLRGCNIILSGLIPLHKQREDYKGPRHPLIRYCETTGAKVRSTVDANLTHVIAAADGSEKVIIARRIPGCYIVSPSWLMDSLWSLTRRQELDYLIGRPPIAAATDAKVAFKSASSRPQYHSITPSAPLTNDNGNDSTDDDFSEDDDFANELWGD